MPKSNFNQFLDECENFRTAENTSMSKISFETKPPCNDECDKQTNQTNQTNQNCDHHNDKHIKTLNTFSSNSKLNTRCSSSSNVFLSKSANNSRDKFDRFSTNGMNNYTNASSTTNVQTNIFKKTDGDNNQCFNQIPTVKSTSMPVVEINNESFPSLTSTTVTAATTASSSVPKKFKNFKDAICASAPAPALTQSPTKQKQTRALPNCTIPPMVVKRDSEMYAKKMLAKTKNLVAFYDNEDDGDDDDDNRDFNCNRNSKPIFMNNYGNDSD